jgi:hypothetical protein
MPGMRQRLMVMENATRRVGARITNGQTNLETMFRALSESIKAQDVAADKRLADFHLGMAAPLGSAAGTGAANRTSQSIVPAS